MKHNPIFACVHCDSSFSSYTGRILEHHPEITCIQRPFDDNPLMRDSRGKKKEPESVPSWFLNTKKEFNTKFFGITSIARDALDLNFFKTAILVLRHPFISWVIERSRVIPDGHRLTLSVSQIEEFIKYCRANLPSVVYWLNHSNLVLFYEDLLKDPTRSYYEMYKTIGASEVTFRNKVELPYDEPLKIINNPDMIHLFLRNFPYREKLPFNLQLI